MREIISTEDTSAERSKAFRIVCQELQPQCTGKGSWPDWVKL